MQTLIKLFLSGLMLAVGVHLWAQPHMVSDNPDGVSAVFGSDADGNTEDFHCPPWHTLGTIDVHHDGSLVYGVEFACSKLLEDGRPDNRLIPQVQLGYPSRFGTNSTYKVDRDCYPKLLTGIHGNVGARIDSLGGYCGNIDNVAAGQYSQTLSAIGGGGGSFARSECQAGQIPTGALVHVADAGHIQGIELICGDVYGPGGPLVGELGLLDLAANGGINPATGAPWQLGDQYRLAFVSSQPTGAYETSIGYYNAFVRRRAEEAGFFVDWRAIGSTAAVSARDNTFSNPSVHGNGVPIFAVDGRTKVADNYNDLWDGDVDAHIKLNEYGYLQTGSVFTGSGLYGESSPDGRVLGGSTESPPRVTIANTAQDLGRWLTELDANATNHLPVYGLSEVLTVKATKAIAPAPPVVPRDSDFDGIPDEREPMCASTPDPLCYLRQEQHNRMMTLIGEYLVGGDSVFGGLNPEQVAAGDADARIFFATTHPLFTCNQWAVHLTSRFGAQLLSLDHVCSDFDGDSIPDASDEYPTISSWSCDYFAPIFDLDKCKADYSRIQDIYLSVYGTATDPDLVSSVRSHYLAFAGGQKTCVDVLGEVAAAAGVDIEPHYQACASEQSKRSASIISTVCGETNSNSIYSPERCHLGKALYQFVSPSSFEVTAQADWWDWILGTPIDFIAKNAATCYIDSRFHDLSSGPLMSSYSGENCFRSNNNPYEDTIFLGNETLHGMAKPLLEQIKDHHQHTFVRWDYTFTELDHLVSRPNNQTLDRRLQPVSRTKPVLLKHDFFDLETPVVDAMRMDSQACWRSGKSILGYKTQPSCDEAFFTLTDVTPEGDDWYTDNSIVPVAEFYSQPPGFSDGGFMLNRCRVKTEYDSWRNYIATGQIPAGQNESGFLGNLTTHMFEYSCSVDSARLDSLITSSLIADTQERVGMYQALGELGLMAISNAVGLASASKFATAGTRLAKAINFATRLWDGIEASLEISSIAAQMYVLAAEEIPRCRQLTGTEKEACFALSLGGTLVALASAAGEDQLYRRSAKLMEDISRQVPDAGQTLPDSTLVAQKYREKDFKGQIEATRQLVKARNGVPDAHHRIWSGIGFDLPGLISELNTGGESSLGSRLNTALYNLPPQVRELTIFKRKVLEISNGAERLGTVEKSTKLLDLADGFSNIASTLSDSDLRALESMSQADFDLFVDLASSPSGVTWTNQNPRQFLDSFKQPAAVGGACYVG